MDENEIREDVPSDGDYDSEPSSVRHVGESDEEGEDLMDNMEAYVECSCVCV